MPQIFIGPLRCPLLNNGVSFPLASPTVLLKQYVRQSLALLSVFCNCIIVLFLRSEFTYHTTSDNCRFEARVVKFERTILTVAQKAALLSRRTASVWHMQPNLFVVFLSCDKRPHQWAMHVPHYCSRGVDLNRMVPTSIGQLQEMLDELTMFRELRWECNPCPKHDRKIGST